MTTVLDVEPKLAKFKEWLTGRGAEVLIPSGPYELVRFRANGELSVFYFKKSGQITFFGQAQTAWLAFKNGGNWRARPATERQFRKSSKTASLKAIRARDGDLCFYCCEHVTREEESEEHLVALTYGGPDHIANKFLAHKECNMRVGHLSAAEKIRVHTNIAIRKWDEENASKMSMRA